MKTTNYPYTIAKNKFKVKGLMAACGVTQTSISEKFGITRMAVSRVVLNKSTSERIREEIAIRCGTTKSKLWPKKRRKSAAALNIGRKS